MMSISRPGDCRLSSPASSLSVTAAGQRHLPDFPNVPDFGACYGNSVSVIVSRRQSRLTSHRITIHDQSVSIDVLIDPKHGQQLFCTTFHL